MNDIWLEAVSNMVDALGRLLAAVNEPAILHTVLVTTEYSYACKLFAVEEDKHAEFTARNN